MDWRWVYDRSSALLLPLARTNMSPSQWEKNQKNWTNNVFEKVLDKTDFCSEWFLNRINSARNAPWCKNFECSVTLYRHTLSTLSCANQLWSDPIATESFMIRPSCAWNFHDLTQLHLKPFMIRNRRAPLWSNSSSRYIDSGENQVHPNKFEQR